VTTNRPAGESKRASRDRIAAERAKQKAAERRRERMVRVVVAAIVVAIVAGIAAAVIISNADKQQEVNTGALPRGVTEVGGGVPAGSVDAPVLDLWEDFQCPACRDFEQASGATIEKLIDDGSVKVVYHPLSFLDQNLGNDSSRRAAAAAGCAADQGAYPAFHRTVYANQPEREGAGFTDEQLIDFGRQAGITGSAFGTFQSCVQAGTYDKWAQQVAQSGVDNQITQTPTVKLDSKQLSGEQLTPAGLTAAVEAAARG
jgi:protein-disulfide isomerase